ncbi:MAG: hypothetical protein MJD61_01875 [Proteobacteria bacterium]|nr:hypothetical protein [Pseudomonadota bacterium]
MKVVRSNENSYAYIEWEEADEATIREIQRQPRLEHGTFRIEVAPDESIPDEIRGRLQEGRFLVVE